MKLSDLQIEDHKKYFVEKGEVGFSPERNKAVIDGVIKEYDAMKKKKEKKFANQMDERYDAVASFLKAVERGGTSNINRYFGKRELARLRGLEIMEEMMSHLTVKNTKGKIITKPMSARELVRASTK